MGKADDRRSHENPRRAGRHHLGQAPRDVPPGEYQAPIHLPEAKPARAALDLPLHDAVWDDEVSLRREDIYGPDGR